MDSAAAFIRQTCKPQYVAIASVDEVCYHWLDSFTDALVWIGMPNYAIPSFLTNNGKEVYTQENMKLSCFRGSFALVGKAGCGDDGKVGKDCDASVQWQFKPRYSKGGSDTPTPEPTTPTPTPPTPRPTNPDPGSVVAGFAAVASLGLPALVFMC